MQIEEAVVWCGQCRCKLEDTRQYKTTEKNDLIVTADCFDWFMSLCLSVSLSWFLFGFVWFCSFVTDEGNAEDEIQQTLCDKGEGFLKWHEEFVPRGHGGSSSSGRIGPAATAGGATVFKPRWRRRVGCQWPYVGVHVASRRLRRRRHCVHDVGRQDGRIVHIEHRRGAILIRQFHLTLQNLSDKDTNKKN